MLTIPRFWLWSSVLVAASGCMYPQGPGAYPGNGYPYPQQPMYAPPQNLNAPGTLVIPPSSAPAYNPAPNGSTYENSPLDDWKTPANSGTSGSGTSGDDVPKPRDPGSSSDSPFYDDDPGKPNSGVQFTPDSPSDSAITVSQPAADAVAASRPLSYGFDTMGYRWIQGVLNFHEESKTWSVTYDRRQEDSYQGDLTLQVESDRLMNLKPGVAVHVQGQVDKVTLDSRGRATYRVRQIFELPMAVAGLQNARVEFQ